MAVYLVELVTVDEATRRRAIAMLPSRYPEIELVVPTGGELTLFDFQIAFFVVGGLSAFAGFIYFRLPADAGSNVSGHRNTAIEKE